jgi:hypothetical protein
MQDLLSREIRAGQFIAYSNSHPAERGDAYKMTVAKVVEVDNEYGILIVDRLANVGGPVVRNVRQRLISTNTVVVLDRPMEKPAVVVTHPQGQRRGRSIPKQTVKRWKEMYFDECIPQARIAAHFRVNQSTVSRAIRDMKRDKKTGKYYVANENCAEGAPA